jgi:hypothetical protein
MRKIITLAALLAAPQAFGQQFYYDGNGRMQGYSVPGAGGNQFYYGANGQQLGHAQAVPQTGSTFYYGPGGQSYGYSQNTGGFR